MDLALSICILASIPLVWRGTREKAAEVGGSSSGQGLSMLTSHVCLSLAAWASSLQRSPQVNNLGQRLAVLGCPSPPDHGAPAVIKPRLCCLPAPPSRRESNEGWWYWLRIALTALQFTSIARNLRRACWLLKISLEWTWSWQTVTVGFMNQLKCTKNEIPFCCWRKPQRHKKPLFFWLYLQFTYILSSG